MLVVLSPAKRLDWSETAHRLTEPAFGAEALRLAKTARNLTLTNLQALMSISPELARLNRDRFRAFAADPSPEHLRAAVTAFAGDTYQGLQARTLDAAAMAWADDHLRILSGLYGLLRPRDGIQPYRLEMGSRLKTRRGATLYAFWGAQIAQALRAQAHQVGARALVNCASQEYFGAVDLKALGLPVVTPIFMEDKPGGPRIVSFFAKRARGAMARFIVQGQLTDPAALVDFDLDGYEFRADLSAPQRPVFCRAPQAAAAG